MSEPAQETPAPQPAPSPPPPPVSMIRRLTIIVVLIGAAVFVYSIFADRTTPYTDQARVQAFVVRMAPDVPGRVGKVTVVDNQRVKAGHVLFEIDRERYALAVETARAQLAVAGQGVGASTAGLSSAEAASAEAQSNLANVRLQSARIRELHRRGFESKARDDEARTALDTAEATVVRTKAEVERARQSLGPTGANNPEIRQAQAALNKAVRDLADTVVRAPADGVVTNLQLAPGEYVPAGQPALTFFDAGTVWIDAEMEENALENIAPGDPVDVVLDIFPGRVYRAKVESIGWGVDTRQLDVQTGLPAVNNDSGWIREPQRFVVRIQLDPETRPRGIRLGSQADVVVYTGKNWLTDALGRVWIVLVALFSYVA